MAHIFFHYRATILTYLLVYFDDRYVLMSFWLIFLERLVFFVFVLEVSAYPGNMQTLCILLYSKSFTVLFTVIHWKILSSSINMQLHPHKISSIHVCMSLYKVCISCLVDIDLSFVHYNSVFITEDL